MFSIDNSKVTKSDLPIIIANYEVFHFDEYPILFSGTNSYGNKIIGSIMYENDEEQTLRYIHLMVSDILFQKFITQKISYQKLILSCTNVFIIDKDINDKLITGYQIEAEDIPNEYLPIEGVMCPEVKHLYGFDIVTSLKGLAADIQIASPSVLSSIQVSVASILDSFSKPLKRFADSLYVRQKVNIAGSFKLQFNIVVKNKKKGANIFVGPNDIMKFISLALSYSISDLSSEAEKIASSNIDQTHKFKVLRSELIRLYEKSSIKFKDKDDKVLIETILDTIPKLVSISGNIGDGFTWIEVLNIQENGENETQLGIIDDESRKEYLTAESHVVKIRDKSEKDNGLSDYRIHIYDLSKTTRKGAAYIHNIDSDDEMSQPIIEISGDSPLENTKYTESLYKNKWINVKAVATKIKDTGRFKKLIIEFEEE